VKISHITNNYYTTSYNFALPPHGSSGSLQSHHYQLPQSATDPALAHEPSQHSFMPVAAAQGMPYPGQIQSFLCIPLHPYQQIEP
jgi:hypothetical protein